MLSSIKYSVLFILLFSFLAFSQTDWVKWEKADLTYQKVFDHQHRNYKIDDEDVSSVLVSSLTNTYWFFISDLDGDNCPFRPSCSSFLAEAAKKTNLLQGLVMFFDRFTRDMNIYRKYENYPRVKNGRYYDPVDFYLLSADEIKYIPAGQTVDK